LKALGLTLWSKDYFTEISQLKVCPVGELNIRETNLFDRYHTIAINGNYCSHSICSVQYESIHEILSIAIEITGKIHWSDFYVLKSYNLLNKPREWYEIIDDNQSKSKLAQLI
jgi:hypothetical protein